MNYDLEIENAINKNLSNYANIFDFRETPNEELFKNYYIFCRENLDIHSVKFNIQPNVFVFKNSFSSNAEAIRTEANDFGILVNIGLIGYCINNLLNNTNLDLYVEELFPETVGYYNTSVSELAFQIATQFSYYHELGHLIQFSKRAGNFTLRERGEDCNAYDEIKHVLEINADTFASITISTHIQQYIEKSFGENVSQKFVEETIVILCSCLLNYITSFYDNLLNIYFASHSHPHPVIRAINVILNVTHHLNQSPYLTEKNITINPKKISKDVFDFYENLEVEKVFETNFSETLDAAVHFREQVIEYLGQLIESELEDYFDALEKWNEHII
jgi:hypothetical protein